MIQIAKEKQDKNHTQVSFQTAVLQRRGGHIDLIFAPDFWLDFFRLQPVSHQPTHEGLWHQNHNHLDHSSRSKNTKKEELGKVLWYKNRKSFVLRLNPWNYEGRIGRGRRFPYQNLENQECTREQSRKVQYLFTGCFNKPLWRPLVPGEAIQRQRIQVKTSNVCEAIFIKVVFVLDLICLCWKNETVKVCHIVT